MKLIKRLFGSDVICKTCEKDKSQPEKLTIPRKDKKGRWDSLDIFGEEKWDYIKNGIIKLYGIRKQYWDYYNSTSFYTKSYMRFLQEIPLCDIPNISYTPRIGNNAELSWDYQDYDLCADISKVSYEHGTTDGIPSIKRINNKIWHEVNVITPVKIMSEMIMREREKKKEQEEILFKKREKFLNYKDDTICDLLKVVAGCEQICTGEIVPQE